MASHDVPERVREVLEAAEEPLTPGRIQRRIADEGFDVATSAIRDALRDLEAAGDVEGVGDPVRTYRIVD